MDVWLGALVITAMSWAFANTTIGIARWIVTRRHIRLQIEQDSRP
jgi:hypothetical protein